MMMQMNQQFDLAFNFLKQNTGTHLFSCKSEAGNRKNNVSEKT